jgi:poly(3-hydroxybutyrate) depolymerase
MVASSAGQEGALDRAFDTLWSKQDISSREKAAAAVVRLEASFDSLYQRLERGPLYSKGVKKGQVEENRKGQNGLRQEYVFLVPEDYDPEKKYRVAFYLHGGVNRSESWRKGDPWWRRFDRTFGPEQISVFPSSWRGSLWWQSSQIENLAAILDRIKREYNVDENRVYLFGVSDGATGVYYHAGKAPSAWAAFLPFIGHPGVLENPTTGVDGKLFVENLANGAFFVVNGEKDELYPVTRVKPYLDAFAKEGAEIVFHPQPGGHNTRWWNTEQAAIDSFVESHPRNPLPDQLVWETERTDRFARAYWLVIEELDSSVASGKAALRREGNRVEAQTRGISRFRLLLAPRAFDLSQPVEVVVNGTTAYRGGVERNPDTLMRWAARDNDRTMLFGAELSIAVPPSR